jgi:aconitate hydratase
VGEDEPRARVEGRHRVPAKSGLDAYLDALGFNLVGYGCTTCIGNSGPLPDDVSAEVEARNLVVASVLSGNRNFEGRIQQQVRANYLASPPLVVAYALAGKMTIDLTTEPIGIDSAGVPVYLRELWPTEREIQQTMLTSVTSTMFREQYADVFSGDDRWKLLQVPTGDRFAWDPDSTYIRNPPFFENITMETTPVRDITGARVLAPARRQHHRPITSRRPARSGRTARREVPDGARRPADRLQLRTGAPRQPRSDDARHVRQHAPPQPDGARHRRRLDDAPAGREVMTIFDAAMKYKDEGVPLLVIAGKEYGSGSSRDWAAKGTLLLGVTAVVAESFERIHRSNLVNMGVLPLQFQPARPRPSLGLTAVERYESTGIAQSLRPGGSSPFARSATTDAIEFQAIARIDTPEELVAFRHGGILPYVLRQLWEQASVRWAELGLRRSWIGSRARASLP